MLKYNKFIIKVNCEKNRQIKKTTNDKKKYAFDKIQEEILHLAFEPLTTSVFLSETLKNLPKEMSHDEVEIRFKKDNMCIFGRINNQKQLFTFDTLLCDDCKKQKNMGCIFDALPKFRSSCKLMYSKDKTSACFITEKGSIAITNCKNFFKNLTEEEAKYFKEITSNNNFSSIALIPMKIGANQDGQIFLKNITDAFSPMELENSLEVYADIIGICLGVHLLHFALGERIKELSCLYKIRQIISIPNIKIKEMLKKIIEEIPSAFQYPEIASVSLILDNETFSTKGFNKNIPHISEDILTNEKKIGEIFVGYNEKKPNAGEGPFLKEEKELLKAIATEISLVIENKKIEEMREEIEGQLRHADRLATIGQLSAGIAHELNEPLSGVLGFAQLIKKNENIPMEIQNDLQKIENAALYAREVIRKLLLFARQSMPNKTKMDLNKAIKESMEFLLPRCAKSNIQVFFSLNEKLPEITADPMQMSQVVLNLVINSIQAMPSGGKLSLMTDFNEQFISLSVKDTGIGMSEEVKNRMFLPFFTTKKVGEGTGLGLSVVYGIIKSHKGNIIVESKEGVGTNIAVKFDMRKQL